MYSYKFYFYIDRNSLQLKYAGKFLTFMQTSILLKIQLGKN